MDETEFIWMDGELVPWKEAKIHVLTHTLHYGAGVFEGERFYETDKGPVIFRLKDHTDRLFRSAEAFEMKIPFTKEEINKATIETIKANKVNSGYIRPIAFFGYGKMGLNPEGADINVAIAVWPWGSYLGEAAIKVKIPDIIRIHPKTTDPDAKICGNYANSILASLEIKKAGYDEALLLDYKGLISEGPGENFFIVTDGKIYTPKLGTILPGITRKSIIQIAKDEGIELIEKDLTVEEAKNAQEVFFSGTAAEVTAIKQIDDTVIGDGEMGPITTKLKNIFMDVVHGKNNKYEHWLTYVNE
jgi:branched-chain amino acid aminotransferase